MQAVLVFGHELLVADVLQKVLVFQLADVALPVFGEAALQNVGIVFFKVDAGEIVHLLAQRGEGLAGEFGAEGTVLLGVGVQEAVELLALLIKEGADLHVLLLVALGPIGGDAHLDVGIVLVEDLFVGLNDQAEHISGRDAGADLVVLFVGDGVGGGDLIARGVGRQLHSVDVGSPGRDVFGHILRGDLAFEAGLRDGAVQHVVRFDERDVEPGVVGVKPSGGFLVVQGDHHLCGAGFQVVHRKAGGAHHQKDEGQVEEAVLPQPLEEKLDQRPELTFLRAVRLVCFWRWHGCRSPRFDPAASWRGRWAAA